MIEDILPPGIRFAEAFDDAGAPDWFPEEEAAVARAVAKRRGEFATVRRLARTALGELGVPRMPLLPGRRGAPQWPAGIVGSMTHCAGYRGAVATRGTEFVSVGIDAEPHEALPEGVLDVVARPEELEHLAAWPARGAGVSADRLLFSAKESVFKTWYPLTGRELGTEEASITFTCETAVSGSFTARLLVPGPVVGGRRADLFTGRWTARRGLLLTAVALPAVRISAHTAYDGPARLPAC
ncbi:4'-phosphopantetheinyl transferase family protein [Streptomyces genisteinicus]|uniref:4'-phosphopantetheinyl transferase superfamily protein n=1 Tax=Streptomyces genisteinicus TaxID=2768068 RepID=A0A7H0HZB2_9ACTN|nr:4'-phosphopantetheinyl transferase superfamily protein [Streptomyces genisteinicus]QNP65878.1 4'-phosphopantetheinyl transferase superfamily protein [Streptomyces genisteinicus]